MAENVSNELAHLKCDHCGYQRSIAKRTISSLVAPKCGLCHEGVLQPEPTIKALGGSPGGTLFTDYGNPPPVKGNSLSILASMGTIAGLGIVFWFIVQTQRRYPVNIYVLFGVFGLLLTATVVKKRRLERRIARGDQAAGPYLSFLRGSLEFLIPFTVTAFLYSTLQWWVTHVYRSVDYESSLRMIEEAIRSMRVNYITPVKLSDFYQWLVIVGVIILGVVLPRVKQWDLPNKFKMGFLAVNRVYIFITLLASFTFFGNQVDKVTTEYEVQLNRQIDGIRNLYSEYRGVVEEAVRQDVAEEIVNHPDFKDVYDDIKESLEDAARDRQQVQILYSLIRVNWYLELVAKLKGAKEKTG